MRVARWLGLVLVVTTAHAEPLHADEDRLEGCDGVPARDRVLRAEAVGGEALHVVARSSERFLVFPHQEGGCQVYPIGRAAARAAGRFGAATKAFALQPPRCGGGSCGIALAIRGAQDRPLAALRTDVDCDDSVELRAVKLFPGRDSLELVCHASAGAGWKERRLLVDATGDALTVLYQLDTGSYIALSPDEQKAGACPSRPVGSIRVEKVAAKPVLRVVDPASGELQAGKGTLPARQLAYDPDKHSFVPTGAPDVPTKVDAQAGCKR